MSTIRILLLMIALGGLTTGASAQSPYIPVGEGTRAPVGWLAFCEEYYPECETTPSRPVDIVLTQKAWGELNRINKWVNSNIKPVTDIEHWGMTERWNYPDDGRGDCEDYVLQKRRMLIQAGAPREALLITIVRTERDEVHAVLTVKTDRGEFVLDYYFDEVRPWYRTGYRFIRRQDQSDPNVWVSLDDPAAVTGGR